MTLRVNRELRHKAAIHIAIVCLVLVPYSAVVPGRAFAGPPTKPDYWPMKVGNSWSMNLTIGGQKFDQVVTVTSAKPQGGGIVATLDYKVNGQSVNVEMYRITSTDVSRFAGGPKASGKANPPLPMLRYPVAAGKSWNWSGTLSQLGQNIKSTATFTFSGPESVTTPAGTFKAMHVHTVIQQNLQGKQVKYPSDTWYVSGIGVVKMQVTAGSAPVEMVLKKYSVK